MSINSTSSTSTSSSSSSTTSLPSQESETKKKEEESDSDEDGIDSLKKQQTWTHKRIIDLTLDQNLTKEILAAQDKINLANAITSIKQEIATQERYCASKIRLLEAKCSLDPESDRATVEKYKKSIESLRQQLEQLKKA